MGTLILTLLSFQKLHCEVEEEVVSCTTWQVTSHRKDTLKVLPPSSGQDPKLVRGSRDEFPGPIHHNMNRLIGSYVQPS